jgi:hypothetical protein
MFISGREAYGKLGIRSQCGTNFASVQQVPALLALRFLDVSDAQIDSAVRDFAHALSQIQDVVIEQVPAYQLHQAMAALNPDWAAR